MLRAAGTAWQLARLGALIVVGGFAAIVAASVQGMALVPGGSIVDGYDVGLLPWMDVGTWLVPIGGMLAAIAAVATTWLGSSKAVLKALTIPAALGVAFWVLLMAIGMAPHSAVPDAAPGSSGLQTVVYSRPLDTVLFLLVPGAVLLVLAGIARRGSGLASRSVTG